MRRSGIRVRDLSNLSKDNKIGSRGNVTFGSDQIRTYQGRGKRPSPVDSYQLSSPERVLRETRSRPEETKTAGAEPEFPSVPKEPQRDTRGDK